MHEPLEPIMYSIKQHTYEMAPLLTRTYNICLDLQGGEMKTGWNCTFTFKAKDNMVTYSSPVFGNTGFTFNKAQDEPKHV
jgi:hypothetical protein